MAAKDGDRPRIVAETADLWFHCMVMLAHYGLRPEDVLAELARREGRSGLDEKACARTGTDGAVDGAQGPRHDECLFCRIAAGESVEEGLRRRRHPGLSRHQPGRAGAFLIVPKTHLVNLYDADSSQAPLLGKMFGIAGGWPVNRAAMTVSALLSTTGGWEGRRCIIFTYT
jgi:hypothetical protein